MAPNETGHYRGVSNPQAGNSVRFLQRRPPPGAQASKIDPLLEAWQQDSAGSRLAAVIVSFRDTVTLPRFPFPDMTMPRDDPGNAARRDTAQMRIADIRAARAAQYAADTALVIAHGGRIREVFWLVQAALAQVPLDSVTRLASEPTVRYVELEDGGATVPYRDASIPLDVAEARRQINSDPYRDLGLDYGWVGLVDTGVDDHIMFAVDGVIDGSRVASRQDFVFGESHDEDTAEHPDDTDEVTDVETDDGHGTCTMGILTGNGNCDVAGSEDVEPASYEGVTAASVNSYRVYWRSDGMYVCRYGAVKALEASRGELDPTLVVELDVTTGDESVLVDACNGAFDTGAAVVVAAGNVSGSDEGVSVPARAHRVLGIGGYVVNETERTSDSGHRHGPTEDDARVKPEVIAPTGTKTASADGCTSFECRSLAYYSGTSGATPYAAGTAVLWTNWLRAAGTDPVPGLVYAFTIVSGRDPTISEEGGAGPIRMPSDGWAWYGSVEVDPGRTQPIEIEVPWGDAYAIEAAIWWPEDEGGEHSYHELNIVDPDGTPVETGGDHATSVFQRASHGDSRALDEWPEDSPAATPLATGTWTVEIARATAPTYTQTVYYAIVVRAGTPPASGALEAAIEAVEDDSDDPGKGRGPLGLPCWLWWWIVVLSGLGAGFLIYRLWWRKG